MVEFPFKDVFSHIGQHGALCPEDLPGGGITGDDNPTPVFEQHEGALDKTQPLQERREHDVAQEDVLLLLMM